MKGPVLHGLTGGFWIFLGVQVLCLFFWAWALLPNLSPGADPLVESSQQIWSGGGHSLVESDFRTGRNVVGVGRFHPLGDPAGLDPAPLLLASFFMLFAQAGAALALRFYPSRILLASGAAIAGLLSGLLGCLFIAMQWLGDTAFPPGFLNAYLLNALTRAYLLQVSVGFVFLAVPAALGVAGLLTPERSFAFRWASINWAVVAAFWLIFYLVCHVIPFPFGDEAWRAV